MTEIEILNECHDESIIAAIVTAVEVMLASEGVTVELPRLVRCGANVPIWNFEARQNNLV